MTSKAQQAYTILKEGIMGGTYGPGFRLVIDQLVREHGISSGPWRESLRRLEAEGWVEFIPNAGAMVKTFDTDAWKQTIRLLSRLEGLATSLSAPAMTKEDISKARELNNEMETAIRDLDTGRFGALNRQFHELLCSRCNDTRLVGLVETEWARMDIIRRSAFWYAPGRAMASLSEHSMLVDLIEGGAAANIIESAAQSHELNTMEAVLRHEAEQTTGNAGQAAASNSQIA